MKDLADLLRAPVGRSFELVEYTDGALRDPVRVAAANEIERLVKVIEGFATHWADCELVGTARKDARCTCGLEKALRGRND